MLPTAINNDGIVDRSTAANHLCTALFTYHQHYTNFFQLNGEDLIRLQEARNVILAADVEAMSTPIRIRKNEGYTSAINVAQNYPHKLCYYDLAPHNFSIRSRDL